MIVLLGWKRSRQSPQSFAVRPTALPGAWRGSQYTKCRGRSTSSPWDAIPPVSSFPWEKTMSSDPSPLPAPTPEELKAAWKAFKKRLKLTQLDDQSRIGVGPMSSGRDSGIVAITPPDQYPQTVWDELARQGKLKRVGNGQYALK
jgi:hypothetical protein